MTDILEDLIEHSLYFSNLLLFGSFNQGKLSLHLLFNHLQVILTISLKRDKLDEITDGRVIKLGFILEPNGLDIIQDETGARHLKNMVLAIFIQDSILLLQ